MSTPGLVWMKEEWSYVGSANGDPLRSKKKLDIRKTKRKVVPGDSKDKAGGHPGSTFQRSLLTASLL